MHWRRKWQPTPVFLPGESQGRGSLVGGHVLKAVPVLQLVPQEASDGALVAPGQGPWLQALISQGHAEEDPKICGPHPARTREHLLLPTAPAGVQ